MRYRSLGAQLQETYFWRLVSLRKRNIPQPHCIRGSYGCPRRDYVPNCTCSGQRRELLHIGTNIRQHAHNVTLASLVCLTLFFNAHPAVANNVVRKQQSLTTYAASTLNERGRPPSLSIAEQVRAVDELNSQAQAAANSGAYQVAVEKYSSIVQQFPGLALSERARIRRAVLLYETGQVQQAILELDDEEVELRGNAEVHAALAALLYAERPLERQRAELQWELANEFDKRYNDLDWVARSKNWGPKLLHALDRFLSLQ